MCSDNSISLFVCKKCSKERPKKLEQKHKRNHCKICDSYKRNLEDHPINSPAYSEFEQQYMHALDLRERGMVECIGCGIEAKREELHKKTRRCAPCHFHFKVNYKREQRFKKAMEDGREFKAKSLHDAHIALYVETRIHNAHVAVYVKARIHDAHVRDFISHIGYLNVLSRRRMMPPQGKRKTILEKLSHLSDTQVRRIYNKTTKPWNNPRLSGGEAWRIRYSIDNEFVVRERLKAQLKKRKRKEWIASCVREAIKRSGESPKVHDLLGYTINDLMNHLEKQFASGMNWDEFRSGNIHIDHIIPIAAFDMNDPSQVIECWSLSNLQPLWARDNIAKSDLLPDGTRASSIKRR